MRNAITGCFAAMLICGIPTASTKSYTESLEHSFTIFGEYLSAPDWFFEESIYAADENDLYEKVKIRADKGDAFAQILVGRKHTSNAKDDPAQHAIAAQWYKRASDQDHPVADFIMGEIYARGHGVEKDFDVSLSYTKAAAGADLPIAKLVLSNLHFTGGRGVERDTETARAMLIETAESDFFLAQYRLGWRYYKGRGFFQDYAKALRWFEIAAEYGHMPSMNYVGLIYLRGNGVERNDRVAVKWFEIAAEYGYAAAQFNLGLMYEKGWGVPGDIDLALIWYKLSASQEHEAAVQAVERLEKGRLDQPVTDNASSLGALVQAAKDGNVEAFVELGKRFENGEFGERDDIEAYKWYSLAADAGSKGGRANRDFIATRMSSKDVEEAKNRAVNWLLGEAVNSD